MWQLLAAVFPLAVGAAFTPTLFGLQMLVVSGPQRRPRSLAVILGAACVFAVIFALGLLGLSQLPDAHTGSAGPRVFAVELLAGVVLLAVSGWLWLGGRRLDGRVGQKLSGYSEHASPVSFAGVAASMSVTDVSSIVLVIPALHLVTVSAAPVWADACVIAFLFACVLLPVWLPPVALRVGGDRAARVLDRMHAVLMRNEARVMGLLTAAFGVVLFGRAVAGLA
ncbi:MAG TPA: GAP family protein [Actinomycetota bacterium]|nr:GAP family protein [Actinomycetota bacterium]